MGMLAVGLLLAAAPAQADTFSLTSDHCTGGCGTPPFGTVTVLQNGTTVDVTVSLAGTNQFVQTGAGDSMYFKFNGIGVALADITVNTPVGGSVLDAEQAAVPGGFNGDGTGDFTFGIDCDACSNGAGGSALPVGSSIVFHVANATIADLTGSNNKGNIFVADILSGTTGNTGPVDVTETPSVPEPSTLPLVAVGVLALFAISRLRRRRLLKQRS